MKHRSTFAKRIAPHVSAEVEAARALVLAGESTRAFERLERAHVVGQASTVQHVRVHIQMLVWAWRERRAKEFLGQSFRIVGAATKTAVGLVPEGNTGGANISPFKRLPVPLDLATVIASAKTGGING
jgi:Protein of unknown function (DUF3703)